ncbi:trans-sulfuration enzyme family protein [Pelagibius sp.]|uniref:trans-sulfuration enzyme family protein n=1 Tax=Pelagibius sp. TaxID=1931238 RepID=UPI003BAE71CF
MSDADFSGRRPGVYKTHGFAALTPPTVRGSTVVFDGLEAFSGRSSLGRKGYSYGLNGTPTTQETERQVSALHGATETFLTPSGLQAITVSILGCVKPGQIVLLPHNVYGPVRRFANGLLASFGIECRFYEPNSLTADDFDNGNVALVWIESPASLTMDVEDIKATTALARSAGARVGCDNSWATPFFCKPLDLGVDVVIEALTKYLSGHSDVIMGSISIRDKDIAEDVHRVMHELGVGVSPDDCSLVLRGLESAEVRLSRINETAQHLAEFLGQHPLVLEVCHPALPSFPGHHAWKRNFTGSSGLFSFVLDDGSKENVARRLERMKHIPIGASWGGTKSIIAAYFADPNGCNSMERLPLIRLSTGLEPLDILLDDFRRFLR